MVQKFDVPLAQATTSSLEALQAYSLGVKATREKGTMAALLHFQRSVQLDQNFAMGYRAVGNDYFSLGELGRASEYFTKAFELREHASEREKLLITADYYLKVTGELDRAALTYQEQIANYPHDKAGYFALGIVYSAVGQYEKAIKALARGNNSPLTLHILRASPTTCLPSSALTKPGDHSRSTCRKARQLPTSQCALCSCLSRGGLAGDGRTAAVVRRRARV